MKYTFVNKNKEGTNKKSCMSNIAYRVREKKLNEFFLLCS